MDSKETKAILSILKAAYPNFYKDLDIKEAQGIVNLWTELFKNDSPELVSSAVKALIVSDEKGYPPHIGAIKNMMWKLTSENQLSPIAAFDLIDKATKGSNYKEEFEKLPPILQKVVASPDQLYRWAMMTASEFHRYESKRIMDVYKEAVEKEAESVLINNTEMIKSNTKMITSK